MRIDYPIRTLHRPLGMVMACLCCPFILGAQNSTFVGQVQFQLLPKGKLNVAASVALSSLNQGFQDYLGTTTLQYWVRSAPNRPGVITVRGSSEFSPSGGPRIANGDLKVSCSAATIGTPCAGAQTLSMASDVTVLQIPGGVCTGGGTPCTSALPNSMQLQFQVTNDPQYSTGTYAASVTFTITTP